MNFEQKRFKDLIKLKSGDLVDKSKSEGVYPIYGANGIIGSINKKNIKNSTLLIGRVGSAGAINIASEGFASDNALIVKVKNNNSVMYIYYFLSIFNFSDIISKTSQPLLVSSKLLRSEIEIPPLEQQTAIANFLDIETSKIDKKIDLLSQKFEKLEEYKKSVIFEIVTKGLDSSVPMKDSGIDWIGDIPAHWEVKRVKDILNLKGGGIDKKINDNEELVKLVNFVDVFKKIQLNNKQEYMIVSCPKNKLNDVSLKKNDILITPSSETPKEIGLANIVLEDLNNTVFSYHVLRLRSILKSLNPRYAYHYFNSKLAALQFENKAMGTTRVTLSRYDILSNFVFYPSKEEQDIIVNYIDNLCLMTEAKKSIIKKKIKLLGEYKQSLIYEAVTGKLRVE